MGLKEKLQDDMKKALKSSDKLRLKVIRFVLSQIKNAEIDKGGELSDEEIIKVISKEIKKIEEAAEEFKNGGNAARAEEELKEAEILKEYLPEPLTSEELEKIIDAAIEEVGAKTLKDLGAVMKVLMPKIAGRADGKIASEIVKKKLS